RDPQAAVAFPPRHARTRSTVRRLARHALARLVRRGPRDLPAPARLRRRSPVALVPRPRDGAGRRAAIARRTDAPARRLISAASGRRPGTPARAPPGTGR